MIYHICTKQDWEKEKGDRFFGETEIKKFGFIHSSNMEGIRRIIGRFDNVDDFVALSIDERMLEGKIRYEKKDADHLYPHFYEMIDREAIQEVSDLSDFLARNHIEN